jgi:hypothetical protein
MSFEYAIIGGYLEIDKAVFAKEMLRRNSRLLKLLGSGDLLQKPIIKKMKPINHVLLIILIPQRSS